ncbi:MAG TPA: outer membrane lipoprotein-sorting protein [Verrucomicrobiae bacterium]|nr:outer membrane lipoprotein-sorting protein [Verrucomicrobiae bacterium]
MEEYQIQHKENSPNIYVNNAESSIVQTPFSDSKKYAPFAHSDFWLTDLGLEFFHWPQQKILPHTTNLKRGRSYTLLESTNPNPTTNGYSRVLSWIDKESGGILEAEAYDFNGKLLKNFAPKSFKKVNGQWELQEMEIRNVQTGSRTRLEFDLKKP